MILYWLLIESCWLINEFWMIKILNLSSRSYQKFWSTNSSHYFSTASDPYYILGVDKAADFK